MTAAVTLIVEQAVADRIEAPPRGLVVVPRRRAPWYRLREEWAPLDPSRVVDVLSDAPEPGMVLARGHAADPGAGCLPELAALLGIEVRRLPDALAAAAWSASLVSGPDEHGATAAGPAIDVLSTQLGPDTRLPPLRPGVLRRWAACAWRACSWCPAGGLAGHRCPRCGSPLDGRDDGGRR